MCALYYNIPLSYYIFCIFAEINNHPRILGPFLLVLLVCLDRQHDRHAYIHSRGYSYPTHSCYFSGVFHSHFKVCGYKLCCYCCCNTYCLPLFYSRFYTHWLFGYISFRGRLRPLSTEWIPTNTNCATINSLSSCMRDTRHQTGRETWHSRIVKLFPSHPSLSPRLTLTTLGIGFTEQNCVCFLKILTFQRLFQELLNQY